MKKLSLAIVFVLITVACGDSGSGSFDPEAGFTQGSQGELRALAYAYQPASRLVYGYSMDMDMGMSADLDVPDGFGDITMGMSVAGSMAYDISAGAEEGSVVVSIRPEVTEFSVSEFTVDGEAMPDEFAGFDDPAAAGLDEFIPPMTVTLDSKGDVLAMQVGDVAVPSELLGSFGGGGFGDPSGMSLMGTLFGPELPVEEVRVGATWTTTDTQEIPFAGEMTVVTHHEIVAEENRGGRDTFVIESVSELSPLTMNFADMLKSLQDPSTMAELGMSADDLDMAQLEADLFEQMDFDFSMTMNYDKLVTTTWLDYEAGITAATDGDIDMTMIMKIDSPEGGGDMSMNMSMNMSMILIEEGAGV
ncbi:MAG: hypothetical protein OES13_08840 [Acidimicrobiia bacterium]|nr:hypothetical protein [Acidimicrobiia bacterium]